MITHLIAATLLAVWTIGLLIAVLCPAVWKRFTHGIAVNIAEGTHANGVLSKRADAAHSLRHLVVKEGSDDSHIAVAAATDEPLGVCPDQPAAAEDVAALFLFGVYPNTIKLVGSAAIEAGEDVCTAGSGKVQPLATAVGLVWLVGKAVSDCTGDGGEVEVAHCKPVAMFRGSTTKAGATLAVPITHRQVVMTTGGSEALTLADGIPGQRLNIVLGTDGGDGTLTPTTKTGFSTIVFADAGDRAELEFVNATVGWILIGTSGTAAPPVTT